jgi:hypothetical protein
LAFAAQPYPMPAQTSKAQAWQVMVAARAKWRRISPLFAAPEAKTAPKSLRPQRAISRGCDAQATTMAVYRDGGPRGDPAGRTSNGAPALPGPDPFGCHNLWLKHT